MARWLLASDQWEATNWKRLTVGELTGSDLLQTYGDSWLTELRSRTCEQVNVKIHNYGELPKPKATKRDVVESFGTNRPAQSDPVV